MAHADGSDLDEGDHTPSKTAPVPHAEADSASREEPECPLCKFIEAGPCRAEHQVWSSCRKQCERDEQDFVEGCRSLFETFYKCTVEHRDYYTPFLQLFNIDPASSAGTGEEGQPQGARVAHAGTGGSDGTAGAEPGVVGSDGAAGQVEAGAALAGPAPAMA